MNDTQKQWFFFVLGTLYASSWWAAAMFMYKVPLLWMIPGLMTLTGIMVGGVWLAENW